MTERRVAVVQHPGLPNAEAAHEAIAECIIEAANLDAELVLLPALHNNLYFCQDASTEAFSFAESIPGPSTDTLSSLASDYNIIIVASLFEERTRGLYHHTAVVIENTGEIAGKYRQMHIPAQMGYDEKYYFTPGERFQPITSSLGKLGILQGWDQWYPESARLMALAGAELLLCPAAMGWVDQEDPLLQKQERDAWQLMQRAHAIANGLPLLAANRVGFEESLYSQHHGIDFWGSSFIAGPQGELLARAGSDESIVLVTDLDLAVASDIRQAWPYLRDRRIDAYQGLTERYLDDNEEN